MSNCLPSRSLQYKELKENYSRIYGQKEITLRTKSVSQNVICFLAFWFWHQWLSRIKATCYDLKYLCLPRIQMLRTSCLGWWCVLRFLGNCYRVETLVNVIKTLVWKGLVALLTPSVRKDIFRRSHLWTSDLWQIANLLVPWSCIFFYFIELWKASFHWFLSHMFVIPPWQIRTLSL